MSVACGAIHSCAALNGEVWCWGDNELGELGDGTQVGHRTAVRVQGLPPGARAVVAAYYYTCALVGDAVWCWGSNEGNWLGADSLVDKSLVPVRIKGLSGAISALVAGLQHTCVVITGRLWCWGPKDAGLLGEASGSQPVLIEGLPPGIRVVGIAWAHACAAAASGAWCWGDNMFGNLGHQFDTTTLVHPAPVQVDGPLGTVAGFAPSKYGMCALAESGVECWGGEAEGTATTILRHVDGLPTEIVSIAGADNHFCAIVTGEKKVMCWGRDSLNLGNGSTQPSDVAVEVSGDLHGIESLSTGWMGHTCAASQEGVWCWGRNTWGQLGNGTVSDRDVPVAVLGLPVGG